MTSERCVDLEPLQCAWLDGMLDEGDRARMGAHLERCSDCRADVEGLARTRALLRSLPVRRLPEELHTPGRPRRQRRAPDRAPSGRRSEEAGTTRGAPPGVVATRPRLRHRVLAGLAVVLGLVGGTAFAVGGDAAPGQPRVPVPVELFVADHLVHTVGGPVSTPVVVDGAR